MRKKNNIVFIMFLVISMLFSSFGTIGSVVVSAQGFTTVLYEMYVGNDKTNQENGTAPYRVGNRTYITNEDFACNATHLGGDDKTMYSRIDVGGLYYNDNGWAKYGGLLAYFYDEVAQKNYLHLVQKSFSTAIAETAWVSFDILIDEVDGANVDLNNYYFAITSDWGQDGDVVNLKYFGVTLSNYMTPDDIGKFKRISFPIQDLREGLLDEHIVLKDNNKQDTELFPSTSNCGGFAIMYYAETERERGQYNDLYVDNLKIYDGSPQETWNPVDKVLPYIAKGSALDLSFMNDAPAGKHGFIKIDSNGDFYFEDTPDKKERFYGANLVGNMLVDISKEQAESLADILASMGYNVARIHYVDGIEDWMDGIFERPTGTNVSMNPPKLDNLEYAIAKLKEKGIYITIDVISYLPFDGIESLSVYNIPNSCLATFFPEAMAVWKALANEWLTHVNPYTGLALKDDPVLIGVSPYNENITYNVSYNEAFRQWLNADVNKFLTDKGQTTVTLTKNKYSLEESFSIKNKLIDYHVEKNLAAYSEMKDYLVNELGIKAPIGGFNMLQNAVTNLLRTHTDVHETHQYNAILNGGGTPNYSYYPGAHPRLSMVFSPKSKDEFVSVYGSRRLQQYMPSLALTQIYNKPFILSEYNHEFPSKGREDIGMMTAAVGAYNGWDMLNRYAWGMFLPQSVTGTMLGGVGGGASFTIANDHLGIFSEIQGGLIFRKGNITEAEPKFAIVRYNNWTRTHHMATVNPFYEENMTYLTHMFKTVNVFVDKSTSEKSIYKITSDLTTEQIMNEEIPAGNKITIPSEMGGNALEDVARLFINKLDDPILKNKMLSELDSNRLVSDTGELIFDLNLNTYLINLPNMVGAVGTLKNNSFEVGKTTLKGSIDKGTMSATSLDDKDLEESGRILIIYTTDVAATGEEYKTDPADSTKIIYTRGTLPTLIKYSTGEFKLTTERNPRSYVAYKLDMHGNRLGRLPITINGDEITVKLETDLGFAFELVSNSSNFSVNEKPIYSFSELSAGDTITADFNVINDTEDKYNAVAVLALYKENMMVDIKTKPIELAADEPIKNIEHSIKLPDLDFKESIEAYKVKSFLIDSMESITPLKERDVLQ